eukprot:GHUV01019258.1.p2 GENE.GHUV01019258.1~~GHUV01019258.1.p2  ORF type:complete len:100 (+),score=17.48 GHUV01019258.1:1323-1622(+)
MHRALESAAKSRCVVMPVLFDVSREEMEGPSSTWHSAWDTIQREGEDLAREAAAAAHSNLRRLLDSHTTQLLNGKKKSVDLAVKVAQTCEKHVRQGCGW